MYSRIRKYKLGRENGPFARWYRSARADYLHFLLRNANRIREENIVFFDVEFHYSAKNGFRPKLVVWHETKAPKGHRKHNIVWDGDIAGQQRFISALYRARYIVGYNSYTLDIPALKKWGLDEQKVLLKLIDPYEYIFKKLSKRGAGSLDSVSRLNGGLGKYNRRNGSKTEFQIQCQRDVKILDHLFWKVLIGDFKTSRFGPFQSDKIWEDLPKKKRIIFSKRAYKFEIPTMRFRGGVPA